MGWWGFDLQEWETHVTVALRVFVIGTACLVRLRGHSQLLGCSTEMQPDPSPQSNHGHINRMPLMYNCTSVGSAQIVFHKWVWGCIHLKLPSSSFFACCIFFFALNILKRTSVLNIWLGFQSFSQKPQTKTKQKSQEVLILGICVAEDVRKQAQI